MSRFGQVKAHIAAARERDTNTPTLLQFPINCKCDYSVAAHFLDISNYTRFLPLNVFIDHVKLIIWHSSLYSNPWSKFILYLFQLIVFVSCILFMCSFGRPVLIVFFSLLNIVVNDFAPRCVFILHVTDWIQLASGIIIMYFKQALGNKFPAVL